jgi:hypothetical protein
MYVTLFDASSQPWHTRERLAPPALGKLAPEGRNAFFLAQAFLAFDASIVATLGSRSS